jgi:hypothetical protein
MLLKNLFRPSFSFFSHFSYNKMFPSQTINYQGLYLQHFIFFVTYEWA